MLCLVWCLVVVSYAWRGNWNPWDKCPPCPPPPWIKPCVGICDLREKCYIACPWFHRPACALIRVVLNCDFPRRLCWVVTTEPKNYTHLFFLGTNWKRIGNSSVYCIAGKLCKGVCIIVYYNNALLVQGQCGRQEVPFFNVCACSLMRCYTLQWLWYACAN